MRPSRSSIASSSLIALLAISACGAPRRAAVTPIPPPSPSPVALLQKDLGAIFETAQFDRSFWSVLVRTASTNETLYALNSGKLVMPGSNMKILTLAAAVDRLGWDYRFETRIVALAPLESGVLHGDLFIVGSGDPTISERSDEHGILHGLVQQLREVGVRKIDGRVVGDDDAFPDQPLGDGWAWDNLPYGYSAPVSALEYNEGSVDLVIRAGSSAGEPVAIQVRPDGSGLEIDNQLITVDEAGTGALTMQRSAGSARLTVRGQIPAKAPPFVRTASVDNPTRFFADAFRLALVADGVQVADEAIDFDSLPSKPDLTPARTLASRRSPPLKELAGSMMKVSQNQYAELLLRAIGGRESARERLRALGVADDAYVLADGSGLSRYNYVTDEALVGILQLFHQRAGDAGTFAGTLAVAGRDGTLARRLTGTPAEGRVRAKSGTIDNVRAMSGYVDDAEGETLVFSMIANNFAVPTALIDAATDQALVRLATFRRSQTAAAGAATALPLADGRPRSSRP